MIIVRSKPDAEKLVLDVPHAFISITDPGVVADLKINEKTIGVLRLQFGDIVPNKIEGNDENPIKIKEGVLFSPEMANQIFDFIADKVFETLVVHCHAGLSRSAGVASFLARVLGEDDKPFFAPPRTPNAHVRTVMRHVWHDRTDNWLI